MAVRITRSSKGAEEGYTLVGSVLGQPVRRRLFVRHMRTAELARNILLGGFSPDEESRRVDDLIAREEGRT